VKYAVNMTKEVSYHTTIEVEADSADEAEVKARSMIASDGGSGIEWDEFNEDFDCDSVDDITEGKQEEEFDDDIPF
jgi:hypothetical protein